MPATGAPDFSELLRRHRRQGKLTQEELAERAGISPAAISLLERGLTQAPQRATAQMLSDALQLAPDEAAAFIETARKSGRIENEDRVDIASGGPGTALNGGLGGLLVPLTPLIGR